MAYLADLREGIHLRVLGRGIDSLSEFHKEAIRAFASLFDHVAERSTATFRTVPITGDGVDLAAAGLKRPTATWTYLVHDNSFGTDIDRAIPSVGGLLRRVARP
jgi:preprotein translocase subunit SecA